MSVKIRTAVVKGGAKSLAQVEAYLPANYSAVEAFNPDTIEEYIVIVGQDRAGWTLDDYVLPRLASGLIFAEEVTS